MSEAITHNPSELQETDQPSEVLLDHATLYHGSATAGIEIFQRAENSTIGDGTYFVDNIPDAAGYARRRSRYSHGGEPIVYGVEIGQARLVNLDNEAKLHEVMAGFSSILRAKLSQEGLAWFAEASIITALDKIGNGIKPGRVREATFNQPFMFTEYLQSLGYDGIKSQEGGEGNDIGNHVSYVIFDAKKIGKPFLAQHS